ncbi:hypothetical protein BWI96_00625 [Siphonobacter sp. SORGH_AS_0500]|uniref:hypothetical protein n=1 Tax=Siphonobacter sp. SORGH_AS_0500 TaxID=1864824 RepID=UPI000CB99D5C|nr:hypothetical protein [Siphonobacter sp. SORGH_AS_0500]PKK38327.1 hypothetical protein BWI96_00625 [Siphonobacter sp. SORGH_AS_0500]
MKHLYTLLFFLSTYSSYAQVAIGTETPDPSAQLEISSTDKGLLIPRITYANRPGSPGKLAATAGLIIYQTDNDPGFYFYDGNVWEKIVKKSELPTLSYMDATLTFGPQATRFIAWNGFSDYPLPFTVQSSSPDITLNADSTTFVIQKGGVYSIEYCINAETISGNSSIIEFRINGKLESPLTGIATLKTPRVLITRIVRIEPNSTIRIKVSPSYVENRIAPTVMDFYPLGTKGYIKITKLQ